MNDEMWRAIVECDSAYDGQFFYGVRTTGIFCRPSCRSKTPKREHVKIFLSAREACDAGLRPCKRCRPDDGRWRSFEEELADRLVQLVSLHYHEPLTLREMAAKLYVSPYYLLRSFQKVKRITPTKYLLRKRLEIAQELLANTDESVTDIAMRAGFSNPSHFAAVFHRELGCSPTAYRQRQARRQTKGVVADERVCGSLPVPHRVAAGDGH